MIPKEAIEKAIVGGWIAKMCVEPEKNFPWYQHAIALDPSFWQALGVGLGNKPEMRCTDPKDRTKPNPNCNNPQCEYAGYKDPRRMFESFCSLVWEGKDTKEFWDSLLQGEK